MRDLIGVTMQVTCKTQDVLETIRRNREEHVEIVAEAKVGFYEKAKKLLTDELARVTESEKTDGKVTALGVHLPAPDDHTEDYDTIIKMLELHQQDTISLSGDEVRQFIENKWGWMDRFLVQNSYYSAKAAGKMR